MKNPDYYYNDNDDDDPIPEADRTQEENETQDGSRLVKRKHGRTIDHMTVPATPLDVDLLPVPEPANVEDNREIDSESPRALADKTAKQQVKDKLAAAQAQFGKLPAAPKKPANDNFRPVVSWPLMDQLTRSTFEPDRERRTQLMATARYIRDLIDLAGADPLGQDCDVQRTDLGTVYFEHGQTLDRKKRIYDSKNDEQGAERYDGSVRTATKSIPIGNSVNRTDPFAQRVVMAREELAAIASPVGPLWASLVAAISEDATLTDIGLALGAKSAQAPAVGSAIIRLALTAAFDAIDLRNWLRNEPRLPQPLPDKTRGSFWNQSSGPVIPVAA
ncbi:hypothetical protein SAMN05216337_102058 [Bradyrhizobium brasilense]|uniref:Uncharacterized protein n=1 Tax=Bradyrhizobium brasilense TaxID=1419277 RepID=A0A1G7ACG2_9BRAD|nr:hypothetical protein [Bradyrhizobium brasilense]SDE12157.1 hypothetical protein SAMN05216337_102058 [Bradyrhizobium brasilense]